MSALRGLAPDGKLAKQDFILLDRNAIGPHRTRCSLHEDNIPLCTCKPAELAATACGERCLNRLLNTECVEGFCRCAVACQNQRLQRRAYASFRLAEMGGKGLGLQAAALIPEGSLIAEYIGEVVNRREAHRRALAYQAAQQRHTYIMTLSPDEVIDATQKGGHARFINHSCSPNCQAEKWLVAGEICIAIVALRNVQPGEELTYDYKLQEQHGSKRVRCECGAASCRGYLGTASRRSAAASEASRSLAAWDESESSSQAGEHDDFNSDSDADVQQPLGQHSLPAAPASSSELVQMSDSALSLHHASSEGQQQCAGACVPVTVSALSGSVQGGQDCRPGPQQVSAPRHSDRPSEQAVSCNTLEADTSVSIGSYGVHSMPESGECSRPALQSVDQGEQRPADKARLIPDKHAAVCQSGQQDTHRAGTECAANTDELPIHMQQHVHCSRNTCVADRDISSEHSSQAQQVVSNSKWPEQSSSGLEVEPTHDPAEAAWLQLPWCHYHVDRMLQQFELSYWTLATSVASYA